MRALGRSILAGAACMGLCVSATSVQSWADVPESKVSQEGLSRTIETVRDVKFNAQDVLAQTKAASDGWKQVGSEWYYYQNGVMLKNKWIKDKDLWYYLSANGTMSRSSWIKTNNEWYHVGDNGAMQADQWLQDKGKWYYLQPNGAMVSEGWIKDKGIWYYFDDTGVMLSSQWVFYKDFWYYLTDTGAMHTGFLALDSKVYYLDSEGRMLKGWQHLNNDDVYFNNSGAMQLTERRALLLGETSSAAIPMADIHALHNTFERLSFNGKKFKTIEDYPDKTKDQIVAKIKSFFANAQDSDVNYLFITAHGGKGYLAVDTSRGLLYASELRSILDGLKGKFVVMVDACHSGSLIGKESNSQAQEFMDEFLQTNNSIEKGNNFESDKYIVFASSTSEQLSYGSSYAHVPSVATHAWSLALGWNQINQRSNGLLCDISNDQRVSLTEFVSYSEPKINEILKERHSKDSLRQDMVSYSKELSFNIFARS